MNLQSALDLHGRQQYFCEIEVCHGVVNFVHFGEQDLGFNVGILAWYE
jgi:hypothetical protein